MDRRQGLGEFVIVLDAPVGPSISSLRMSGLRGFVCFGLRNHRRLFLVYGVSICRQCCLAKVHAAFFAPV